MRHRSGIPKLIPSYPFSFPSWPHVSVTLFVLPSRRGHGVKRILMVMSFHSAVFHVMVVPVGQGYEGRVGEEVERVPTTDDHREEAKTEGTRRA